MILVKVTLLLAGAFLLSWLLRRRTAALRHLNWTLALAGTLGLTALSPLVPELRVSLPASTELFPSPDDPGPAPERAGLHELQSGPDRAAVMRPGTEASSQTRESPSAIRRIPLEMILPLVYLLGFLAVLSWYLIGRMSLRRLVQRASPLGGDWSGLLSQVAREMGVTGNPRLFASPRVGSPITWGLRDSVVVLPSDAVDWPLDRRRIVLAHELTHAARGDHLARLIGVVACAAYWFHPLVWAAFRRQGIESERAADDHVLIQGTSGMEYATHLLDIARRSSHLRTSGLIAIGMARLSHLEGRLLALLDESRNRAAPTPRVTRAAWGGLMLATLPIAALQPAAPAPGAEPVEIERLTAQPRADTLIERTVPARAGETLALDLETGGDVTLRGWNRPELQVRARLAGADWKNTRVSIARVDGGVRVRAEPTEDRNNFSTSHDFEIMLPDRYDVRLESAGGSLTIIGVEGTFRGGSGGGEIRIERAKGDARLTTGGGDIQVTDSDLRGSVSTGGGMVRLSRVRGGLRGFSGSGPVIYSDAGHRQTGDLDKVTISKDRIQVAEGERTGLLHIQKAGGDIILDGAPDGVRANTGGGRIRIGRSAGLVDARTGGGDITIGPVAGSVNAGTGAGDVHITIVRVDGQEQSLEVTAGVGRVVIEWPAGVAARFELETAYTRRFGRRTRIDSDWDLVHQETEDWDDTQGTPRRYVRAEGKVGSGGGLVRVRTVNGDITIRRTP
ncbi:MAG TPA: M56 family metallopeptidase [Gemmatimonadales bacterium]